MSNETDAEIFTRVLQDIRTMIFPNTFTSRPVNPERWAYRVTQDENRAIARHIADTRWVGVDCHVYYNGRGYVSYPPLISIMGVALTRRARFPNPDSIKDYGSSG